MDNNFDKWMDQWQKAQDDGLFGKPEKPVEAPVNHDDFFGNHRPSGNSVIREPDSEYWNRVYRLSSNRSDAPDPLDDEPHDPAMQGEDLVTIAEDAPVADKELAPTTKSDGKSVSKITDELGGLPNPVNKTTRGTDANNRVTPGWAGGQEIIELHKMKEQLQKLEDKLAADPMVENKGTKKVMGQIDTLWKKIDELSDTLTPEFVQEYLS